MQERIRIAFVLGELTVGGAEMMLWKLVSRLDRARFEPFIIALSPHTDVMLERFEACGARCVLLGMRSPADVRSLLRLAVALRESAPHLLQGWMYYGNMAVTFASLFMRRGTAALLWSIRGTLNLSQEKWPSLLAIWLGGKLSFLPSRIINNSRASAIEHEQRFGYRASKRVILPNGFDTDRFVPSQQARRAVRVELGLADDAVLVGLFGRYHPMKDHGNFMRAAALLSVAHPHVHYVLAGKNVEPANTALQELIAGAGLTGRVHLLGARNDMESLTASLDIAVSSSSAGEGFSNVIGEAMSCGVPCVATDVGDSAAIADSSGVIVPPRDPRALAGALAHLLDLGAAARKDLGTRARARIMEHFSLDAIVRRYEEVYIAVHAERRA